VLTLTTEGTPVCYRLGTDEEEYGFLTGVRSAGFVFVRYVRHGVVQATVQGTRPEDLTVVYPVCVRCRQSALIVTDTEVWHFTAAAQLACVMIDAGPPFECGSC
jgi:hypothetical protein